MKELIKQIANELDVLYTKKFFFRNHCYLRIAYDTVLNQKWSDCIKKPFIDNATETQLQKVINLLLVYKTNEAKLLIDNNNSLKFRKK